LLLAAGAKAQPAPQAAEPVAAETPAEGQPPAHGEPRGEEELPLMPRFETPSEIEARKALFKFQTPSERQKMLEGGGNAAPGEAGVDAAGRPYPPGRESTLCSIAARPASRSYFRHQSGSGFLRPPCTGTGPSTFYARGLYSYVSDGFHEWSGAELGWDGQLLPEVAGGLTFHHEYREERATALLARLTSRLHRRIYGYLGVVAGNQNYFFPATGADLEFGARFDAYARNYFGFGGGMARYSHDRQYWHAGGRHIFWLKNKWGGEAHFGLGLLDAPDVDLRLQPFATLTGAYGTHGAHQLQATVGINRAPDYRPGQPLRGTEDQTGVDVSLGFKHWVSPAYGYLAQLEYGYLDENYHRIGVDYAIFFHGP
jgi:hypothetical protein